MIKVLIAKNANINALDGNKRTPLHYAAWKGHMKVIEVLLFNGAKTDLKDRLGRTPLHYLCKYGKDSQNHVEAAKILLDKNPEVINVPNDYGVTPLHWAAYKGHYNICELLLEKGASKNIKGNNGRTPKQAAKDEYHDAVAKLIQEYPNHNIVISNNLHLASAAGKDEMVKDLIAKNANIANERNMMQWLN